MELGHREVRTRNEWLAELLEPCRDLVTQYWIEDIRAESIPCYTHITDEQLRAEFPPTVDSMIHAFRTGDIEGPRRHSITIIRHRLQQGFSLTDLQMSLHALSTAVMRIVGEVEVTTQDELEALQSTSSMFYVVAMIAAAVYDQLRIEQERRFAFAYEFGTTLSRTLDLQAVLDTAVSKVAEYTHAESVAILLTGKRGRLNKVRAYLNLEHGLIQALPGICRSLGCRACSREISSIDEAARIVPDVRLVEGLGRASETLVSGGFLSLACVPLVAKSKRIGSLILLGHEVGAFPESEHDMFFALAGHIARAVQNALLYEEAKGKRELGVLLKASRLFASSLDTQEILDKIARMACEAVGADLAVAFVFDRMQHIAHYASSRRSAGAVQTILGAIGPPQDGVARTITSLGIPLERPMVFFDYADLPSGLESLADAIRSGIVVPLKQSDVVIGALMLISLDRSAFVESDLSLTTALADLADFAIMNARLYEHERRIAETLQTSFLPSSLPEVEGYEMAAFYRPAMAEAEIGGDFYDAFTIDGNTNIIIADVSGKGLNAAIHTAMGKYMVRAYAIESSGPGAVLARFNRAFLEYTPGSMFMTAFHGSLDPRNHVFTYASAGHNPPLFYSAASGNVFEMGTDGMSIGIVPQSEYIERRLNMQPGDVLLLFTDGATDVKSDGERLGVEGLAQLFLSSVREPVKRIVGEVFDGIYNYCQGKLADDVALVALRREK